MEDGQFPRFTQSFYVLTDPQPARLNHFVRVGERICALGSFSRVIDLTTPSLPCILYDPGWLRLNLATSLTMISHGGK